MLVSGRLGAVYGHGKILMVGGAWFILWTLVNAFCPNFIAFNIVRGLSGMGGALILPNAVAIIGTTFPPGKARNLCLGIFGAAAPMLVLACLPLAFTQLTYVTEEAMLVAFLLASSHNSRRGGTYLAHCKQNIWS